MEPIQIIPALTILSDDGDFTVRVGSEKWASELGQKVVSLVAGMGIARKLTILTPSDTKVFKFGPEVRQRITSAEAEESKLPATPRRASERISQDSAAPPSPELVGEWADELAEQQRAEAEIAKMERANKVEAIPPVEEGTPQSAPRRRGRPSKVVDTIRAATTCGRCGGEGQIAGGGQCPVCQGKGGLAKWGTR